jgi:hypothetical protein
VVRSNQADRKKDAAREVKNQQLAGSNKTSSDASVASSPAPSTSKPGSSSGSSRSASPGASAKPSSGKGGASGASGGKEDGAPKVGGGKAKGAKLEAIDRMRAPEAADIDGGDTDQFTGDTSNLYDLRRFMGADEGGAGSVTDVDAFDPNLSPPEVENLGSMRAAVHMVRLMDHWHRLGLDRGQVVNDAAAMLMAFSRPESARGLMRELERAPIHAAYPLEIEMTLVDQVPGFFPNVERGPVVTNKEVLEKGERIRAGHDCRLHFPTTMKLKSLALLTPGQPGYEFEPLRPGVYRMLVDSPGDWTFAIRAEKGGQSLVDTFTVRVGDPGAVETAAPEPAPEEEDDFIEEEPTRPAMNPVSWTRTTGEE